MQIIVYLDKQLRTRRLDRSILQFKALVYLFVREAVYKMLGYTLIVPVKSLNLVGIRKKSNIVTRFVIVQG